MRSLKSVLLSASSLAALSASAIASDLPQKSVVHPKADASSQSGTSISVEGGYVLGDISGVDKTGLGSAGFVFTDALDPLDSMRGYNAAITINRRIDHQWDVAGSLALTRFMDQSSSTIYYGEGPSVIFENKGSHSFETFDIDVGYHALSDKTMDVRLFAGLRGLHSSKASSKLGTGSGGFGPGCSGVICTYGSSLDTEFLGVGPRVGVDFHTRLADSPVGLFGSLSGAMIYGKENQDFRITIDGSSFPVPFGEFPNNFAEDQSKTVKNLDAALGIDFTLGSGAVISAGYKAQQFWNVGVNYDEVDGITQDGHDISHGPFIKLTTQF